MAQEIDESDRKRSRGSKYRQVLPEKASRRPGSPVAYELTQFERSWSFNPSLPVRPV